MISKSLLYRTLALGICSALLIGMAAAQAFQEKYTFTIPAGYWLTVRVAFASEREQNLVLREESGNRIEQWNSHSPEPHPNLGPWRSTNTKAPTEVYFTDYYIPGPGIPWRKTDVRLVTPPTLLPDKKTTYTVAQWSDGTAKNAVTVEIRMSPDKNVAGDLFKAPSPAPANAPK